MTAGTVILIQNSDKLGDGSNTVVFGVMTFCFLVFGIYLLVRK